MGVCWVYRILSEPHFTFHVTCLRAPYKVALYYLFTSVVIHYILDTEVTL